jgi:hypothetical protein
MRITFSIRDNSRKADVVERPEGFHHVGLLANEPPGTAGLPCLSHPTTSAYIIRVGVRF